MTSPRSLRPELFTPLLGRHLYADESDEPRAEESLASCLAPLLNRIPDSYRTALELTEQAVERR